MSLPLCRSCRRLNPSLAAYCYFDGTPLVNGTQAPRAFGSESFPRPFVLPSGRICRSFEELAAACRQSWEEARDLLKEGGYRAFFVGLGRGDLAKAAERAAQHPDMDLGLDEFLARLPGCQPAAPRLDIGMTEVDLGSLVRGQDRCFTLTIQNAGERLLSGLVRSVNCPWLGVSSPVLNEKRFQASVGEQVQLQIYIRGKQLRAAAQPQVGEVAIESNGGVRSIPVRICVAATPFPDGAFQGATTPRQLAEKALAAKQEMARLLENGAVARWYECNGWTYPITGSTATGLAIVQQYFEALGLTRPTRVELRTTVVTLQGAVGGTTQGRVVLSTPEKRPIHAHAQADQPWLLIGPTEYRRNEAVIPLSVAAIPAGAGQTLHAELRVQANGKQCFKVPVTVQVGTSTTTAVKPRGNTETGLELPPLPDAPLPAGSHPTILLPDRSASPSLTDATLPALPAPAAQAPGQKVIPLAEARVDGRDGRSRRILSCFCVLLSLLLLCSAAALAAWKLWKTNSENPPAPPSSQQSAVLSAPRAWGGVCGCPRGISTICRT